MNTAAEPGAYRRRLLDTILPLVRADARVLGCWEGGSAATGRADAYSDIDLCLLAEAPSHTSVLDDFERSLRNTVSIVGAWRIDPPAFAGVMQRVFRLADAPRFFLIDCAVMNGEVASQFLERERHGEPVVYFDRVGTIAAGPIDAARHGRRLVQRLQQIRASWPVYLMLVEKELARDRRLDAIGFYFNGLLRQLVELAGMRHRPERFDYGWRYLHHDLPPALQAQFERLACVAEPAQIAAHLVQADRLAASLMRELAALLPDEPSEPIR